MENELKSCPFCGSRGIDRDTYWHRDYCTNCGGKGPAAGNSPKADWNTRTRADLAPDPLADARVVALVDAVDETVRLLWEEMSRQGNVGTHGGYIYMKLRPALSAFDKGGKDE